MISSTITPEGGRICYRHDRQRRFLPEYMIGIPLTITSVTPSPAAAGTEVTITGTFGSPTSVWLGSALASITTSNNTQVHAVVPANATSGTVRVQQGGLWSNALPFTVRTATIDSIDKTTASTRNSRDDNGLRFQ